MKNSCRKYNTKKLHISRTVVACVILILTVLISACNHDIPETQKHNYKEPVYVDRNLNDLPEFVDDVSMCTDPKKCYVLPDGYLYACQLTPTYSATNQLSVSTDLSGNIFNECGYMDNARIRSVLEIVESDFSFVTGFIPVKKGDTIYFSAGFFNHEYKNANVMYTVFYNTDKQTVFSTPMSTSTETAFEVTGTYTDGCVYSIKVKDDLASQEIAYVRFTLIGSGNGKLISVNESLESNEYSYEWVQAEQYIPADWYGEIKSTVDAVNQINVAESNNTVRFMFAADIHLNPYSNSSYTENLGKVSAEVMRACNIPYFVTGGDNCTQSSEFMPSDFEPNMKELLDQLSPIPKSNILLSVGNHDGATGTAYDQFGEKVYYRFQLSNAERSNVFFGWQRESNEHKKFDSDGTYYYMDDPATKTRYIVLNSFWSQWEGNEEGYVYNIEHSFFHSHRFGAQQLHWFAEEALDMPKEYGAVIVVHFAPGARDFDIFKGIVEAFNDRTTYEGKYTDNEDWQKVDMAVNYTNAYGEIIAVFQGHNHMNAEYDYFKNVPCINTTTTGAYWAVRDENAAERIKGTSSEFAVDVVTIDRTARKIYLTRLGAGDDRVIDY